MSQTSNQDYKNREKLFQKYSLEKLSVIEVSEYFGCSIHNIHYWLKKHNIPKNNYYKNANNIFDDEFWLREKYTTERLSTIDIAKLCKVRPHIISTRINFFKIPKRTMSEAQTGKKASVETKRKMSKAHSGFRHTSESKKKMSLAQAGENHPMWGRHHSEGSKKKISQNSQKLSGKDHPMWGREHTEEAKSKISSALSGENHHNWGKFGKESNCWKNGGIKTALASKIRTCHKYKDWRSAVYTRDSFACMECKDNQGGNLNADHIKPFSLIIKENKITTLEEALECAELWDLKNGRTLCVPCHKLTDTYGGKCVKFYLKDSKS